MSFLSIIGNIIFYIIFIVGLFETVGYAVLPIEIVFPISIFKTMVIQTYSSDIKSLIYKRPEYDLKL
jgi:hypothetical protein